jgi:DNA polymerase-3 subunit beta
MKLACSRKEFADAVSAAAAAASARTTVTILQHLKVEVTDSRVTVLGCDGEMWVERSAPILVAEPGSACLQARLFTELVTKLSDGDIELRTLDGSGAMLVQGVSEYRLQTLDAEDFPVPPEVQGETELKIPAGDLRKAVDSVAFAVSSDSHRAVLTGVLFHFDGSVLTLVATDTHRLAVRKLLGLGEGKPFTAVVPEKALRAVKALPVSDDEVLTLRFSDSRMGVETAGSKVVTQLITGTYPNWERVVPGEHTRQWSVEVDQLAEKVRRAMILARDNANRVRFRGGDDQIVIAAKSEEKGEAKEEVMMLAENGNIEIAFNGAFVLDAIGQIKGPGVKVEMTENTRPAIFRPADDDADYFCVIMPMALV